MNPGSYEDNIKHYIMRNYLTVLELLQTLCRIPAPSNHEHDRAEFCRRWLEGCGAQGFFLICTRCRIEKMMKKSIARV